MQTLNSNSATTSSFWMRLAALAAIAFYAVTAHLTSGHEADFGKQWLAARLIATGHGRELFDPAVQRAELERHFSDDVIDHGIWRDGIGGPTYPPTLAVAFSPLGLLPPAQAQWLVVELSLVFVLVAAWQIGRLTAGRVSWEFAALATLGCPLFFLAVGVGQNSAMSLAILATGFALIFNRRDFAAGLVWGLFAIKPTWGFAVAWVPLVLGRPRAVLGMAASAGALVAITLPICGFDSWFDWLRVLSQTEHFYETLPRWTALSRDVPGLFRRVAPGAIVEWAGWIAIATVIGATAWSARSLRRGGIAARSNHSGCVSLVAGSILSCPRFMFYDLTLAVLPFLIAASHWSQLGRRSRVVVATLAASLWLGSAVSYITSKMLGPPIETIALVGLWLWAVIESQGQDVATVRPPQTRPELPSVPCEVIAKVA